MNEVRAQWSAGLSPAQAGPFRQRVWETISLVETICREHRLKPDQLPAPSSRAYRYLKSLDLDHLPPPHATSVGSPHAASTRRVRLHRLIKFCRELQEHFTDYAQSPEKPVPPFSTTPGQVADFLRRIQLMVETVETLCQQARTSPLALPAPSRRAYLWLKFLSTPENLVRHLAALQSAYEAAHHTSCLRNALLRRPSPQVRISFSSLPALYRAHAQDGLLHIAANEGYTTAPQAVLEALIFTALAGNRRLANKRALYLAQIKAYAQDPAFRLIAAAVERGGPPGPGLPGPYEIDEPPNDPRLMALFQRVNETYFNGTLPMPRLLWNKTITHRKLGHYQDSTDTVMLSLTLDHPQVPEYVLEYVLYHELLHKKLGLQVRNGRRYAHTPTFHAEERKFQQYEQARAFIDSLGKKLNL